MKAPSVLPAPLPACVLTWQSGAYYWKNVELRSPVTSYPGRSLYFPSTNKMFKPFFPYQKCITPSSSSKNQDMHMLKWKSNGRVLSVETMPEPHPRAVLPSSYPLSMRRIQSKVKPIRTAIEKTHPALRLGDLLLMGSSATQMSLCVSRVRDEDNGWPIGWTVGPGMVFFSRCCGEGRNEKLWSHPNVR